MTTKQLIIDNIAAIRIRILHACESVGRDPGTVTLVAVSKTRSADEVAAALAAGVCDIGENYLQEALAKKAELTARGFAPAWHFIGPIQSNKTREIAAGFDWVHSVDREKIAGRLNEQRPASLPSLNVCLQININREASKAGAMPEQAEALLASIESLPRLRIRGLMAIPQASDSPQQQRQNFANLRELRNYLQARFPRLQLDTLSMGMSADLEAAIAEGASIIRIGTDIFGARPAVTD